MNEIKVIQDKVKKILEFDSDSPQITISEHVQLIHEVLNEGVPFLIKEIESQQQELGGFMDIINEKIPHPEKAYLDWRAGEDRKALIAEIESQKERKNQMNKIVLITEQEMKNAITLKQYMLDASQNAHFALDKLCAMDAHIRMISRGDASDYDPDNMDMIQHTRNESYKLIVEIRSIHDTILKKIEYPEG